MAGEWIPVDCCLWEKLEVLRISKSTGRSTNEVVGNLARLWAWSSHNVADGQIECGLDDLEMVVGADTDFWRAVVSVGWLIDNGDSLQIPGWEARFSQTAKSRLLANRRMKRHRDGHVTHDRHATVAPCDGHVTVDRHATVAGCNGAAQPDRGKEIEEKKEKRGEETPQGGDSSSSSSERFWGDFRAVWEKTAGVAGLGPKTPLPAYFEATAASHDHDRLIKAVEAIPGCTYFETPVTLKQFCSPGFVDRILDGHFAARTKKRGKPQDEPRPPKEFEGDDAKRFAATLERLRSEERVR